MILNGHLKGRIVPERGFRQGDPLYSYFFILCTEALDANIQKEESEKWLIGLEIARGSHRFPIYFLKTIVCSFARPVWRNVGSS